MKATEPTGTRTDAEWGTRGQADIVTRKLRCMPSLLIRLLDPLEGTKISETPTRLPTWYLLRSVIFILSLSPFPRKRPFRNSPPTAVPLHDRSHVLPRVFG